LHQCGDALENIQNIMKVHTRRWIRAAQRTGVRESILVG